MRKFLQIALIVSFLAALSAVIVRNSVAADQSLAGTQASVLVGPAAVKTAHIHTARVQGSSTVSPVADAVSFPEAAGLLLMGSGLLIGAVYLRRKLIADHK